jgi:predicted dehydrogenase
MADGMSDRIAVIGTGTDPEDPDREGYAMAYRHANAYRKIDDCRLVACADIVRENAETFAAAFGIDDEHVFENYERMLREVRPDIVSVCVPPAIHAEVVIGAAETGIPAAIHCEKPMADTWGDCKRIVEVCEAHGVQLTINHQRRFGAPFRRTKALLDRGAIGRLRRIEASEGNLFDAGTHLFDLCGYLTDGARAEWVLSALDYREENRWFGTHNENQSLAQWKYLNGVYGLASTGYGKEFVGCYLRLRGSEGVLEIGDEDGPALRGRRDGGEWRTIDTDGETIHNPGTPGLAVAAIRKAVDLVRDDPGPRLKPSYIDRSIADIVAAVRENRESEIAARNALRSTELVFACWESARRRGRVDLPLDVDGNPLQEMVDAGDLPVAAD